MAKQVAKFPEKLRFLFTPSRYKVAYGGRGSGKSWNFARALLLKGVNEKLRILCAREVQRSIKDSVHKLLEDQIQALGLGSKYIVLEQEIRGIIGTEIIYVGLATQTVESIKSYEGVDIVWVEEAQVISSRSWQILIPTIRKEKSEIWVSLNPELDLDPTYVRFIKNTPPDTQLVEVNWRDNPWFPRVLQAERLHDKATLPDSEYNHIWEGRCKPAVEGAIYYGEITSAELGGRIRSVPVDLMLKAHVVIDLGWNDEMAIIIVQRLGAEIRVCHYIEDHHRTLASYSNQLREMGYNWGKVWLPPADGFSKDFKTGKGADQIMTALGWTVAKKEEVADLGVEEGIRNVRMTWPRMYFDKDNTVTLLERLKRYNRKINRQTLTAGTPQSDHSRHAADCIRYMAANIDNMHNETERRPRKPVMSFGVLDEAVGY